MALKTFLLWAFLCGLARAAPDLKPLDLALEVSGSSARWTISLVNQGTEAARLVRFQLLRDGKMVYQGERSQVVEPGGLVQIEVLESQPPVAGAARLTCILDGNQRYEVDWQPRLQARADVQVFPPVVESSRPQLGSPVKLQFKVKNQSQLELYRVPVELLVDGKVVATKTFFQKLPLQAEADFTLSWVADQVGSRRLQVRSQGQLSDPVEVEIADRPGYRLQLLSASVPRSSRLGKEWEIEVLVKNQGTLPAEGVKAVLWVDGTRVWSARLSQPLGVEQQERLSLRWGATRPGTVKLRLEVTAQGAGSETSKDYEIEVTE